MSFPPQLNAILQEVNQQLEQSVARYLLDHPPVEPRLNAAIEYALLNGGKRMRPLLVNIVGNMLGAKQQDLQAISMAIECIHAYSLVHDDLPAMDDDDLRRGNPTCHIKFDEATAILAGDALQSMAFEVLTSNSFSVYGLEQRVSLINALCKAAGPNGMVGGQSLDLTSTNQAISLEALTQLHQLKTGALLVASVQLPCMVSERITQAETESLLNYARHIGLAFQIQDDILDVVSDTHTLGKPQGSDEDANKSTFVSLLGLQGAKDALSNHHHLALQALATLPYNTQNLTAFTDFLVNRTY
ncbi:MAG: farnesyl diphosphate synthase [Glaciecola sp.]